MLVRAFATVAIASAALFFAAPGALAFDANIWERDVALVERTVLQAVDNEFLETRGVETWQEYHAAYREGIQRLDEIVDQRSFQILEEIARQMQDDFQNFQEFERHGRWQDASYYIRSKFVLTSFTLNTAIR